MKMGKRTLRERMGALFLAAALAVTGVLPGSGFAAKAAETVKIIVNDKNTQERLTGVDITFTLEGSADVTAVEGKNGEYTAQLDAGTSYTYTARKAGYDETRGSWTPGSGDLTIPMAVVKPVIQGDTSLDVKETTGAFSILNGQAGFTYSWESDNAGVARVDSEGKVTGVSGGTARITVTCNGVKSDPIEVTVHKLTPVITLSATPEKGTDVATITLTASMGAGYQDAEGSVSFYAGARQIGTRPVSGGRSTYTYSNPQGTDIKFKAVYEGDSRYQRAESAVVTGEGPYNVRQEIIFTDGNSQENPFIITKEEGKETTFTIPARVSFPDNAAKLEYSVKSGSGAVVKVNKETGEVTVKGTGEAQIGVSCKQTNTYQTANTNTYYIFSQAPVSWGDIKSKLTPVSKERVYDGTKDIEVEFTLHVNDLTGMGISTEDLKEDKDVRFIFAGSLDKADAGSYTEITITGLTKIVGTAQADESEIVLTDRIQFADESYISDTLPANVTIGKRTVYVGAEECSVDYGQDVKAAVENTSNLIREVKKAGEANTGVVDADAALVKFEEFKATIVGGKSYNINKDPGYEKEIKPDPTDLTSREASYPNYTFQEDEDSRGTLMILQPKLPIEEMIKKLQFQANDGGTLYSVDSGKKLWISGGLLKATVVEDTEYYDTVMWKTDGREEDLTQDGYDVSALETSKVEGEIYLMKDNNKTEPQKFAFYVDKTAPQFDFGTWGTTQRVIDGWAESITFGQYKKAQQTYSIDGVKAEDTYDTSALAGGVEQSGVKEWKYFIWKVNSDTEITPEAVKSKIRELRWEDQPKGTDSIPVATVAGDISDEAALAEVKGNYVVLVQVSDNVGNTVVCTSNGLIIDVEKPTVTITADGQTPLDSEKYYDTDVPFQVSFQDEGTTSGFASAKITLMDGNKQLSSDLVELQGDNITVTGEGEITFGEKDSYTLAEIQQLASRKVSGTIKKEADSNNLKIVVTAKDQAGNEYTAEQPLKIDNTKPEISVKYNNDADVKNGKYFKTDREMTITYTEKNFSEAGLTFEVAQDGKRGEGVTLAQLGGYGITYDGIEDSQAGVSDAEYTKERTNTLTLRFEPDHAYSIIPHCKDEAGKENGDVTYADNEGYQTQFIIDKTEPAVEVTYTYAESVEHSGDRDFTQGAVTADIKITEKNFWLDGETFSEEPKQMDFAATKGVNALEEPVSITDYEAQAMTGGNWSQNVDVYETRLTFEEDANYTFGFTYTDLAGNSKTYAPQFFTVDGTAPAGEILIDENAVAAKDWFDTVTFNIFKNQKYLVTLEPEDDTAGVALAQYYTAADAKTREEIERLDASAWKEAANMQFEMEPNQQFVVYMRVEDKAKNVQYISSKQGAIADDAGPSVQITNLSSAQNGIYRGDVALRIDATDPTAGDTYSGLEKVWYTVSSTGNQVNSTTVTLLDNSGNRVQGNKDFTQNISIPATQFNSNDVKVQAFATDFSGNTFESEVLPLKIDITAPTIQVSYDLNSPANGKYYNQTRTATVTVTERNFDENAVRFNITSTGGTQPAISGWSKSADAGVMDSAANTCTVSFAADGDYTLTLNCTDLAGNASDYTQTDAFTIDKTVPTIEVSFDNNNVANGHYYNAPRTATITVNEHNFNGAEVQTSISAALQSQGISAPGVNGWSVSGDRHSATASFSQDGDYSFNVNYTDLAGNAAQVYNVDLFTIDQTKPEVEIFDIEDRSANSGEVAPGVRYSDVNYNVEDVEIQLSGPNHRDMALEGEHSPIPNGESIKMADFVHEEAVDDVYTLKAQVTDLAGNTEEDTAVFSVNRFGSNYIFSDATEDFLRKGLRDGGIRYANEEKTLVVTEINVDTLVHNGITYGRDGNLTPLEQGSDYTVKSSGSEESWKRYEYTILARNFEKEGRYDVTIESEDRASNKVNNKIKGADIEFVIDKTSPTLVITGLENDAQYRENSRDVTVSVMDNAAMGEVDIYLDGESKPVRHYEAEAIEKQDGELLYTMESSNNWQSIQATAMDAAGNEAKSEQYRVLLTSNLLVQYYRNTPLFVGSLIAVLAAVGIFILLIVKRRKKDEEEA